MQSKFPPDFARSQSVSSPATEGAAEPVSDTGAAACAGCQAPLPPGASFCPECGTSASGDICPGCSAPAEEQDFCQACGFWLKPGACRFCYEQVPESAAFCPSCGCDQAGIACPGCGSRNFFDFCTTCGSALSEAAERELEVLQEDPGIRAAFEKLTASTTASAAMQLDAGPTAPATAAPVRRGLFSPEQRQALQNLSAGIGSAPARESPVQPPPPAPDTAQRPPGLRRSGAEMRAEIDREKEIERQKIGNVKRFVDRAVLDELLNAAAGKRFLTQQEARRFHMALHAKLKQITGGPNGWLCNRFSYLHLDGPNGCSAPQFGGVWVI